MSTSHTQGGTVFSIQGRLYRERQRLDGMTPEERAWRCQWIRDQQLAHDEPIITQELYRARYNFIRRAYKFPLDLIFKPMIPVLGHQTAAVARRATGVICMGVSIVYLAAYYFKYNANDWTRGGGWRVLCSRRKCVPGDENYPALPDRKVGADYASKGFKDSPI